jgi:hypothetical protein
MPCTNTCWKQKYESMVRHCKQGCSQAPVLLWVMRYCPGTLVKTAKHKIQSISFSNLWKIMQYNKSLNMWLVQPLSLKQKHKFL